MKQILFRILPVTLSCLAACGMRVKANPVGETRYAANPNTDLRFYAAPLEGMEAVGVIEIEGANFDKYQDVRARASEEAARLGADGLLVVREIRQDGSYYQYMGAREVSRIGSTIWVEHRWEHIAADYPVCLYIAVRQMK